MKKTTPKTTPNTTLHYVHPTGFAFGLTAGLAYALCAALVALWPAQTVNFFSNWFHGIDLTKIYAAPQITPGNFITGLIGVIIAAYLVGAFYAWVYNKCVGHCKKRNWI